MSSAPSRSDLDPVGDAIDRAVETAVDAVRRLSAGNGVVLIDGRSGAGKSTIMRRLVAHWPYGGRVQAVALDSLYPGWDGLADGVEAARAQVLFPHARGEIGIWQRWDWDLDEYSEAHAVDPSLPLIVEGAGILTPQTARLADVRLWVESPATSRRHRALMRDGATYRPHWERWARQEDQHIARDRPQQLATHIVDVP